MGFLLRYENVAWYEDGKVKILDRRIYPVKTEYVICSKHEEVAQAIADMVTQSGGPYTAAAMGMALAETADCSGERRYTGPCDGTVFLSQWEHGAVRPSL